MRYIFSVVCFLLVAALNATEQQDIAYYQEGFPRSGNETYLTERCKLDLSTPDGVKDFPTLVWFHGGGLTGGNKAYPSIIDRQKIAVATVNYRLSGDRASCPDYLYDAAAATSWVVKNIARYGGNPQKVYVSGHSAGGYLAAMLALDPQYLGRFGVKPEELAAVLPVSGQMSTHFAILTERRKQDPATPEILLDRYAPIACARANAPRLILLVGDTEVEWPARVEENQLLEAILRRKFKDARVRCYAFETFNHGTVQTPALAVIQNTILADQTPAKQP